MFTPTCDVEGIPHRAALDLEADGSWRAYLHGTLIDEGNAMSMEAATAAGLRSLAEHWVNPGEVEIREGVDR